MCVFLYLLLVLTWCCVQVTHLFCSFSSLSPPSPAQLLVPLLIPLCLPSPPAAQGLPLLSLRTPLCLLLRLMNCLTSKILVWGPGLLDVGRGRWLESHSLKPEERAFLAIRLMSSASSLHPALSSAALHNFMTRVAFGKGRILNGLLLVH